MQGLKVLVVVMGILIVISMGLLGWGIYNRLAQRSVASGERSPIAKVRPSEGLGEVRVDLPAGCAVVEMRPMPIAFIFAPDPPDCASVSSCSTPPLARSSARLCSGRDRAAGLSPAPDRDIGAGGVSGRMLRPADWFPSRGWGRMRHGGC